jgi:hypothetical protein
MILLNLIPAFQKELLTREKKFLIIHSIVGIIVVVIAIHAIILSVARIILVNHFNTLRHDTSLVKVEHQKIHSEIDTANKKIDDTVKIQATFSKWSLLLLDLTEIIPKDIRLDFVHINQETGAFKITGMAPTRSSLLDAKTSLESDSLIQFLDAPLSNFIDKEDINFRFAGQMDTWRYQVPRE